MIALHEPTVFIADSSICTIAGHTYQFKAVKLAAENCQISSEFPAKHVATLSKERQGNRIALQSKGRAVEDFYPPWQSHRRNSHFPWHANF